MINTNYSSSLFPQRFEVKDELKNQPDDVLFEKGINCANASKGAEAAAFVVQIKDPRKKVTLMYDVIGIFNKLDQSSAEAYDAMKGFVFNLPAELVELLEKK